MNRPPEGPEQALQRVRDAYRAITHSLDPDGPYPPDEAQMERLREFGPDLGAVLGNALLALHPYLGEVASVGDDIEAEWAQVSRTEDTVQRIVQALAGGDADDPMFREPEDRVVVPPSGDDLWPVVQALAGMVANFALHVSQAGRRPGYQAMEDPVYRRLVVRIYEFQNEQFGWER